MNKRWPYKRSKHAGKERKKLTSSRSELEPLSFYREEVSNMRRFWDLVKDSVITQGVVTVLFAGTVCYLYATGKEVPGTLIQFTGVAVGFFFGAKQQQIIGRSK